MLVCRPVLVQAAGSFTHSLSNRLVQILPSAPLDVAQHG